MNRLTTAEFEATFDENVELAAEGYNPCLDFWDYSDALDEEATDGLQHQHTGDFIFYNQVRMIEHVMLRTNVAHAYIVIVLDMKAEAIVGHYNFYYNPIISDSLAHLELF